MRDNPPGVNGAEPAKGQSQCAVEDRSFRTRKRGSEGDGQLFWREHLRGHFHARGLQFTLRRLDLLKGSELVRGQNLLGLG